MLLPDAVVLGQMFHRYLGVLEFPFLLSLGDLVDSVPGSHLSYLIRILKNLHLGLGLKMALVLVVVLPSLLQREIWAWMRVLIALQERWRSVFVCFLEAK